MKKVTKTIEIWEAIDGTCFDNIGDCEQYEAQLKNIKYFKVDCCPDLTETGYFNKHIYFMVYSRYGYQYNILENYLRNELKMTSIGPSVMGYGLQLHYLITELTRNDIVFDRIDTILSPIEIDNYSCKKYKYFDYMSKWGLK